MSARWSSPAIGVTLTMAALALRLAIAPAGVLTPDGARDLAAAARLAAAPDIGTAGPLIGNTVAGSPLYYYLLALPLAVFHSATAALVWLAALTALTVPLAWGLGRVLLGPIGGLVFAGLIAVDYWQLFAAMSHSAVDLLPLAVMALLLATAAGHVRRSPRAAFWAPVTMAVAAQVHPVALTLTPLLVLCLGTRAQRRAFVRGSVVAVMVCAPWLVPALGAAPRGAATGALPMGRVAHAVAQGFVHVGFLARTFVVMPSELVRVWSQAVEPQALRVAGIAVVAGAPALALVGLARWAAFHRGRPLGFVLCWIAAFAVLFPPLWIFANLGYGTLGKAPTWYYFFPLEALLPLATAVLFAAVARGPWHQTLGIVRRTALAAVLVLPGVLAVRSFQSLAARGWIDVDGYSQLPDAARLPYVSVTVDEAAVRFVAADRGAFPERDVHALLLGSYVQSAGVIPRLGGIPVHAGDETGAQYALLWNAALPSPPDVLAQQTLGPFIVFRFRSVLEAGTFHYSSANVESAWKVPGFDDESWAPLSIPTLDRTPDASVYPPGVYRDWNAPVVRIRGRLRLEPGSRGLLGIGCASRDVGLDRIDVRGAFLDGTALAAPVWRSAALDLYMLEGGATAQPRVLALEIAVSPHAVLDLFAFGLMSPS